MQCPKCSADQPDGAVECVACGVIFDKLQRPPGPGPRASPPPSAPAAPLRSVAPGVAGEGWRALLVGFGLAALLSFFPFLSFILTPLVTLVHELGHTVFYWIYGYPAYPAFDFVFGGGVTVSSYDRQVAFVFLLLGGLVWLAYRLRRQPKPLVVLGLAILAYAATAFSQIHHVVISAMGHGFELLFAALFLYRGLTGWGCVHAIERPLYAFLAFYITLHNLSFGYGLVSDAYTRQIYLEGKRGIDHDLVFVARQLGWRLVSVARVLVLATALALLAGLLAALNRRLLERGILGALGWQDDDLNPE